MIEVRQLHPDDWQRYRDIRLEALATEPGVYVASHAEAVVRPESAWRERLVSEDGAVFGLFDDDVLVGLTGVLRDSTDCSGKTAVLVMSFIAPAYRRRGLATMFYDARLAWLRRHPRFTRVVVSHRRSNEASRRANHRHGFAFTHAESRTWPDGAHEDELHYELRLRNEA